MDEQTYEVTITIEVKAENEQDAFEGAVADIKEYHQDGSLHADIKNLSKKGRKK